MDFTNFWNDVITQDRKHLQNHFCTDAVILWPCTNEQFNVNEYVIANCEYPGDWEGKIERLKLNGDSATLIGRVYAKDNKYSCHVVSFIDLKNNKISRMEEYWSDDGEAPEWRKKLNIGKPIR